jgi:hypothetical protein
MSTRLADCPMRAEPDVSADAASSSSPAAEFAVTQVPGDAYDEDSPALVSITFLLRNFSEMNKLWTRMQRNLPPSDARDVVRKVCPVLLLFFPTDNVCFVVEVIDDMENLLAVLEARAPFINTHMFGAYSVHQHPHVRCSN